MARSKELRNRAWNSLKGKYWNAFLVMFLYSLIAGAIDSVASGVSGASGILTQVLNSGASFDEMMAYGIALFAGAVAVGGLISTAIHVFVTNPLAVGGNKFFIQNTTEKPSIGLLFHGFRAGYGRNVLTMLLISVKVFLWSLLFMIPGVIKSYEYAIIPYIIADDATISNKEAFAKAKAIMKGKKWKLFKLEFSFIGWYLLSILTLGLGYVFLIPYVEAARAEFYVEAIKE